jgi:hypothetical protein
MGIRKIINSLPLRRKLLRNFLLRLRSNNGSPVLIVFDLAFQASYLVGLVHSDYRTVSPY